MKNNKNFNNMIINTDNYIPLKREAFSEFNKINMEIKNSDIMLVLTINNTVSKEGTKDTITGKITILDNSKNINLDRFFKNINTMNINKLNILSISKTDVQEGFNFSFLDNEYLYFELGIKNFLKMLEIDNFLEYNKNSLYIFRNMNYYEIKNMIRKIEDCSVKIGRGASQKAHLLSPLELRLSSYLMAMFNFDYNVVFKLNMFNYVSKKFYLPTKNN